ncbi:phosphonate metabolism transcriptional regulator PhnF [Paracoccus sp. SCSIO 75233]|uniref:phosphonate metabolism transcriptional regulator PhnF n=1 Tax=Paracoccus sp. SCSIO 75233 TaxID=3017782 RepID=UPI0022F086B2|nr:phosphonate metabolism transcriptional regulator PhnF [Paracoccus sp. SCSIO 75233]WBU54638.1 phosphonate metabolism transcriptional regulator PhnF [Paracoccus sp. SCSIO 75233]
MNKRLNIDSFDSDALAEITRIAGQPYAPRGQRAIWLQIYDRLAEACTSGPLPPGAKLPGENDLAELFDVSRLTIRKALSKLQQEGQLQARKGVGIFIRSRPARYIVEDNLRFSSSLETGEARIESSTLELVRAPVSAEGADFLRLPAGTEVVRLTRLRIVDGAPAYLATKEFPAARFTDFEARYSLQQSVADVYRAHGIPHYGRAETRVTGGFAPRSDAAALHLSHRTPLMIVRSVNRDPEGRPIEFSIGRWPLASVELVLGDKPPEER